MTKYVLVGGYIHKAPDEGKAFCDEIVKTLESRSIKILDCLFGRNSEDWEQRFQDDKSFFEKNIQGVSIELAQPDQFIDQVKRSDVVFFQGGAPRKMIELLGSLELISDAFKGKVVVGSSGGADMLCRYYGVGKTSNIGEGLGFVPMKLIPHWKSDYALPVVIDWEGLKEKLKSYKESIELITLQEGEFITVEQ